MKQIAIIATTHIDRSFERFTKEALEKAVESIVAGSKPLVTVEHDTTIPPYGKTIDAWVEPREDGEFQLVAVQEIFENILWAELPDGTKLFKQESDTDRHPFADKYEAMLEGEAVFYDRANFDSKEAVRSFIEEIKSQSETVFMTAEFGRKSLIPDPEFMIGISKAIVTYLVSKKLIDKAGDKIIELAVDDIAKFYSFVKSIIVSAVKYARPQGRPITYIFFASGNPSIEFIARSADANFVISAVVLERIEEALFHAKQFRQTFGAVRIQYLLNDNGKWEFNYLLTNTGAVIGTEQSLHRRSRRIELLLKERNERKEL